MKSSIYILDKSNMLKERIDMKGYEPKFPKYLTVVFKSSNGEMGFMQDQIGINYIAEFLLGTILWDQKKKEFIDFRLKSDITNYLYKINGLTFFDEHISKLKEQVQLIHSINKKNTIYLRHGKAVLDVPSSPILNYLSKDRISIRNILELKDMLKHLIIWDWGEFGLYFHIISNDFSKEIDRIESVCRVLNIELFIKDNENEIPSW